MRKVIVKGSWVIAAAVAAHFSAAAIGHTSSSAQLAENPDPKKPLIQQVAENPDPKKPLIQQVAENPDPKKPLIQQLAENPDPKKPLTGLNSVLA